MVGASAKASRQAIAREDLNIILPRRKRGGSDDKAVCRCGCGERADQRRHTIESVDGF